MCGLAGVMALGRAASDHHDLTSLLEAMSGKIQHRGPDSSGLWQDSNVPLALGHRRLSIVDLSELGHQPMASADGRYMIAYNGEIYNFLSLRRTLEDAGHRFKGHSDTEVLLAAISHWGINTALQKINGMFAIALWDVQAKELHLIRDRFGKKPLYVGWAGGDFIFASELKAFSAHPEFSKTKSINKNALAQFMRFSYVPAPYSIFDNVWTLPAGHRLTLKYDAQLYGADLQKMFEVYFHAGQVIEECRQHGSFLEDDIEVALQDLDAVMNKAVERRMISDVPLGAFLSGGIDSTLVVAMMQEQSPVPIKTFSIGFHDPAHNEAEHAKAIATHLGTDHHEFYVGSDDVKDCLNLMADMYDEPFADASQIPTYMVAKAAREHVTVVLTGDGGDEMFAGYKRHYDAAAVWRKMRLLPRPLRQAMARTLRVALPSALKNKHGRINRLLEVMDSEDALDFYNRIAGQWHDAENLVRGARYVPRLLDKTQYACNGLNTEESFVYWDVLSHLPDRMMVKVDRATMACAMESRAPFLDVNVFKQAWAMPLSYKVRSGQGKYIVRRLLEKYVPKALFDRPKQGFTPPLNTWLCTDLRDWVEGLIADQQSAVNDYFDMSRIAAAWQRCLQGSEADTLRIWNYTMFTLWYKRWMR
ncbi:MAG: asparagine synthase (glutamine-hydrolyzing) [Alphaproteobacteria bacterium]|nr:asparagine synthase (glutamine-hydrolyzing) [Alphaproteobacteria bacterium]